METIQTIEQTLDNFIPNKIVKKKKTALLPLIYLAAGTLLFIINSQREYNHGEVLYPLNLTLAATLCITGVITFFSRKEHYHDASTGVLLKRKDIYFDMKEQASLVKCVEDKNIKGISNINKSAIHGLKITSYATTDGKWCFMQAFRYEENRFKPVTSVIQLDNKDAETFLQTFRN